MHPSVVRACSTPSNAALLAAVFPNPDKAGEELGFVAIVNFAALPSRAALDTTTPRVELIDQPDGLIAKLLASDGPIELPPTAGQLNVVLNVDVAVPNLMQVFQLGDALRDSGSSYGRGDGRAMFDGVRKELAGTPDPVFDRALRGTPSHTSSPGPTATRQSLAQLRSLLKVTALGASLSVPITTYTALATDAKGGAISYTWHMTPTAESGKCGTPSVPWTQPVNPAQWSHSRTPPDNCAHLGTDHPVKAEVTIKVTSGLDEGVTAICDLVGSETQQITPPTRPARSAFELGRGIRADTAPVRPPPVPLGLGTL